MATEYFTLNTGAKIPAVGFGTWKAAPGDAGRAVEAALEAGYRHIVSFPDSLAIGREDRETHARL